MERETHCLQKWHALSGVEERKLMLRQQHAIQS